MRRTSFAVRLATFSLGILLLSLGLSTAIVYQRSQAALERSIAGELLAVVNSIAPLLNGDLHQLVHSAAEGTIAVREEFEALRDVLVRVQASNRLGHGTSALYTMRKAADFAVTGELEFVVMTDPDPRTGAFFTGNRYRPQPFELEALGGRAAVSGVYADAEGVWLSAAAPLRDSAGQIVGLVQADRPVGFLTLAAREEALALAGGALFTLLLVVPLAILLARSLGKPVLAVAAAARRLGRGDLTQRVELTRGDELGDLARSFNAMADRLEEGRRQLEAQMTELAQTRDAARAGEAEAHRLAAERERVAELKTRLVMQASHEFRTPLAVILAASETLLRYDDRVTRDDRLARLRKIQNAVRDLEALLDEVLAFGRADARQEPCTRGRVDVRALCEEVISSVAEGVLHTHDLVLRAGGEPVFADVDARLVRRILGNLLGNAVKYSPEGSQVRLDLDAHDGQLVLRVVDHGFGIPPEDQAHLFEPFHRGGNVGQAKGFGLGLAITQRAVAAHGGTIAAESVVGAGTTFTVTLPAGAPPQSS
jgi:signal transduction histidine kinase